MKITPMKKIARLFSLDLLWQCLSEKKSLAAFMTSIGLIIGRFPDFGFGMESTQMLHLRPGGMVRLHIAAGCNEKIIMGSETEVLFLPKISAGCEF